MRLGLCCMFRDQPIKFVTTTVAAIGKMKRRDALAKLSRLCLENADALMASLHFCAANGIGCFRINSQILPIKTHPRCGYEIKENGAQAKCFKGSPEKGSFRRAGQRLADCLPNGHRTDREDFQRLLVPDHCGVLQPLDQMPPDLEAGGRHQGEP